MSDEVVARIRYALWLGSQHGVHVATAQRDLDALEAERNQARGIAAAMADLDARIAEECGMVPDANGNWHMPALAAEPREPERCPTCGVTAGESVPAIATSPDGMWPLPCPDLFHGGAAEPREPDDG